MGDLDVIQETEHIAPDTLAEVDRFRQETKLLVTNLRSLDISRENSDMSARKSDKYNGIYKDLRGRDYQIIKKIQTNFGEDNKLELPKIHQKNDKKRIKYLTM